MWVHETKVRWYTMKRMGAHFLPNFCSNLPGPFMPEKYVYNVRYSLSQIFFALMMKLNVK